MNKCVGDSCNQSAFIPPLSSLTQCVVGSMHLLHRKKTNIDSQKLVLDSVSCNDMVFQELTTCANGRHQAHPFPSPQYLLPGTCPT